MSEQQATAPQESPVESQVPSPGIMLKEARERQGLSVEHVASKLFLNVSQVEAIESDKLEDASSITFVKGYVKNYSRLLGIDTSIVISAFEQMHKAQEPEAKLQSFSRRVAKQNHDDRWMMVTYGILILLIAGVVVWWYQQPSDVAPVASAVENTESAEQPAQQETSDEITVDALSTEAPILIQSPPSQSQELPDASQVDNEGSVASTDEQQESALQIESATTSDVEALVSSLTSDAKVSTDEMLSTDDTLTTEAQSVDSETNFPEPVLMVFTFGEDCWVNITDATGEDIAYGVKQSGRVMSIAGVPPVEVTLGAPDNVSITVNGDAVDMSGYNNGRTARFTLPIQVN